MGEPADRKDLLKRAIRRIEALETELASARAGNREPLAIVGLACRFPGGANDPDAFWSRLIEGFDATTEVPRDRWDIDAYYDPDPDAPGRTYTRHGAFLDMPICDFDASFFGIAPREADAMDPQQRLVLEVVWEALERGGIAPASLHGSATGVFVGMTAHDWAHIQDRGAGTEHLDGYFGTGTSHSVAAGRIAYLLGLKGPALTIDTACSSSLVAFHEACQSLRARETDVAIAAGVLLMLSPSGHVVASAGRMLSRDGRCKAFDAAADGYGRGEGCGAVVLKRLKDALADGDRILAIVRGTAINQDGRSAGLTAPNARAQEEVIRAALAASDVHPHLVSYVEAHGTGTELGDPIELQALGAVQAGRAADRPPLYVGSVKTNIGHLEAAAGIAGVIKTVLALQHGTLPPHLHFKEPNPHVPWNALPLEVPTRPQPWPAIDGRRIAGVSSFGFSGTNAHVILEAWSGQDPAATRAPSSVPGLLVLSARTPRALGELAEATAARVRSDADLDLHAVTATLAVGRNHFEHRAAAVVRDRETLVAALDAVARGDGKVLRGEARGRRSVGVAFLFTGQGSQRPGMGRELLALEPVFREEIVRCDEILAPLLGCSILPLLEADRDDAAAGAALQQTRLTQPVLFAFEWALAQLWRSWGVEPVAVAGHSLGEYVAATVAGVLELEDALRLVAERGRLIGELPDGGAMAALFADAGRVRALLENVPGRVSIAAFNGPANTVISGDAEAVDAVLAAAAAAHIEGRRLVVSHAFHSPHVEPVLDAFRSIVERVPCRAPRIDVIANLRGAAATADTFDTDYWVRHVREPVRFAESVAALRAGGARVLLEVGPAPVLLGLAASCPGAPAEELRVASLRPDEDATVAVREALAALYVAGVNVRWDKVEPGRRPPVALPTYPFERVRHWRTPPRLDSAYDNRGHPLLGAALDSPWLSGKTYEAEIREDAPAWIGEHLVFGRPVLPAAGFVEMARAAVARAAPGATLADFRILQPLQVQGVCRVQLHIDGERLEIASRRNEGEDWRTHVTARVDTSAGSESSLAEWPSPEGEALDPEEYLAAIAAAGVEYKGAFRTLVQIRRGHGVAWGEIDASRIPDRERRRYGVHPALLDAAFQLCGACFEAPPGVVYLPVGTRRLVLPSAEGRLAGPTLEARAVLREGKAGAAIVSCDVELRDPSSGNLLRVEGLEFQRAAAPDTSLERRVLDWLYELEWVGVELGSAGTMRGRWCVVGSTPGVERIARMLRERGLTVEHGASAEEAAAGSGWDGIVWIAPDIALPDTGDVLTDALRPALEPLLVLGQAAAARRASRVCVITRNAFAFDDGEAPRPAASAVWGLTHAINAELGSAACRAIDVPAALGDELPAGLTDAIVNDGAEERLAWRDSGWKAARLARMGPRRAQPARPGPEYRLAIRERGRLDELVLEPDEIVPLEPDQVRIRVRATGLNFRDVLNALGTYPGDAGPLGSECVGTVEATGTAVEDLVPGDLVMAITPRGFCSQVTAPAALTVKVPAGLTACEAATVPIAFLTADWALGELAELRAGERVLIHAAAGGVGLAAVQLALAKGAEIYATAGSERKRSLLRRIGIRHVYDSRSLDFREQILRDTDGEGVHVVLNSLADDFVPASLDVLGAGGRFIEIGKTGIWDPERVRATYPGVRYHVLYLGDACIREPHRVRERFLKLCEAFASGTLRPLPYRAFTVDEADEAFRYMAQARHLGKIVLVDSLDDADRIGSGAAWITGGLGGLGLSVARDFVNRGCRRIALSGRGLPSAEAEAAIAEMRASGAEVLVVQCDVARIEDVRRARAAIEAKGWSLRHVLHAAGVLDDAVLSRQSWRNFESVLPAKAAGAWNLHQATLDLPFASFVLFSAGAGLLGSPGQANYAAANVFLDGLAALRRSLGLSGLSVAWGAWRDVGMAARAGSDWSEKGLGSITPELGTAALRRLMREDNALAAVLPIDWTRFPTVAVDGRGRPFFELAAAGSASAAVDKGAIRRWRPLIEAAPARDRNRLLEDLLGGEVSRVLGFDPSRSLPRRRGLTELGIDSLMAVELTNRIASAVEISLPTTFVFENPTIEIMAAHLLELLAPGDVSQEGTASDERGEPMSVGDDVSELSADEASAALLNELDRIGY